MKNGIKIRVTSLEKKNILLKNKEMQCFGLSKSVKISESNDYPLCDSCNHNMIPEYEYRLMLGRMKQESVTYNNDI